jgi:hypothetical protein
MEVLLSQLAANQTALKETEAKYERLSDELEAEESKPQKDDAHISRLKRDIDMSMKTRDSLAAIIQTLTEGVSKVAGELLQPFQASHKFCGCDIQVGSSAPRALCANGLVAAAALSWLRISYPLLYLNTESPVALCVHRRRCCWNCYSCPGFRCVCLL